ncbi:hypothetical protein J6590_036080 [Homalodisca vitripennis]|nr:hypothetical protein J6590_036080 [Homalodisca vitripennis]
MRRRHPPPHTPQFNNRLSGDRTRRLITTGPPPPPMASGEPSGDSLFCCSPYWHPRKLSVVRRQISAALLGRPVMDDQNGSRYHFRLPPIIFRHDYSVRMQIQQCQLDRNSIVSDAKPPEQIYPCRTTNSHDRKNVELGFQVE